HRRIRLQGWEWARRRYGVARARVNGSRPTVAAVRRPSAPPARAQRSSVTPSRALAARLLALHIPLLPGRPGLDLGITCALEARLPPGGPRSVGRLRAAGACEGASCTRRTEMRFVRQSRPVSSTATAKWRRHGRRSTPDGGRRVAAADRRHRGAILRLTMAQANVELVRDIFETVGKRGDVHAALVTMTPDVEWDI